MTLAAPVTSDSVSSGLRGVHRACLRAPRRRGFDWPEEPFRISEDIPQFVERSGSPELLPIFRSRHQAELLADILDDPDREQSLAELTERLGVPTASVHREIDRAERAGIARH